MRTDKGKQVQLLEELQVLLQTSEEEILTEVISKIKENREARQWFMEEEDAAFSQKFYTLCYQNLLNKIILTHPEYSREQQEKAYFHHAKSFRESLEQQLLSMEE